MNKLDQSNRRILFWTIYSLDALSSLQLGVPRLLKDYEIECALPITMEDKERDKTKIKLEGTVSPFSLAIFRFSKILGNILDMIFKRNMTESMTKSVSLIHENALDQWRYDLPEDLTFKLNIQGSIDLNVMHQGNSTPGKKNLILMFFYFFAVSMIHLPVVAARPLDVKNAMPDRSSSSYIAPVSYTHLDVYKRQVLDRILEKYSGLKFDKFFWRRLFQWCILTEPNANKGFILGQCWSLMEKQEKVEFDGVLLELLREKIVKVRDVPLALRVLKMIVIELKKVNFINELDMELLLKYQKFVFSKLGEINKTVKAMELLSCDDYTINKENKAFMRAYYFENKREKRKKNKRSNQYDDLQRKYDEMDEEDMIIGKLW